ncbi:flagellar basal body rod protein FlgB [Treponema sp. OMZ 840]|uniref:flagellar basal body rod protein FlgB n=1 Tax=Treponema sp. OMZ 840 TaxID=244313 RepID=UPI003D8DDAEC
MNGLTRTLDILHRALDVNALRYQITAHNLTNAETPNYKRTEVNFESQLKRAFESEKTAQDHARLITSDPRHISNDTFIDYRTVEPRRVTDYWSTVQPNGSNVDPEQEAMNVLKTQMTYQLLSQLTGFHFSQAKVILK